jgi:PAS domain S-box-containing protein
MPKATRPALLILLALPIILLSAWYSWRNLSNYREANARIARLQDFLRASNDLRLQIQRAESSQRGFVLTGRESYLRPYEQAVPLVWSSLAISQRTAAGLGIDSAAIRQVDGLVREKLDEMSRTVVLFRQGQKAEAMQLILTDEGDRTMTTMARLLDGMFLSERARLERLRSDAIGDAKSGFAVSTAGDLILLIFLIFAGAWIDREIGRRARAQESIRSLNAQLAADLDERKRLLDDVQEARALLDTLFENAPVGLGVWDRDLRFLRVNRALAEMNGIPAAQHIGKTIADLLPDMDPAEMEACRRVVERGESILSKEVNGITPAKPGKERAWIVNYYPIRIGGDIMGAGAVWEEVTERKAMEGGMRQAAKLESLGVLAGGIAHDFNNLLTGILGNASLAADSLSPNSPVRSILGDVVLASERAAHLTRQLLAYAGKGRFVLQLIDLAELVKEIGALVRMSIPRNVQLRFDLGKAPAVLADPGQMQQLVMNLVINGAEAIPPGEPGTVAIGTGSHEIDEDYIRQTLSPGEIAPGPYVYLEVHDTGTGMDEDTISRIFDPFFTTKFTGRGLGLAAVLGIVRGHKGALKVYSAVGKGTTFKVLLPVAEADDIPVPAKKEATGLEGSGIVLVIDDEDIVRRATKATLERYGYTVVLAADGGEGVDMFRSMANRVSAVLLDLTMPVISGEDALRQIHAINPNVKVILSSGFNEVEAVRRFTGKGLAGFLQKPYTAQRLAEMVRRVIEE